jgi:hypothetical protein
MLLKVEGLKSTVRTMDLLGTGEHIWVRGIGKFLIYICRLGESSYRVCICSVEKVATRFSVKKSSIDAKMSQVEAFQLVEKLGARPCRIVKNKLVEGSAFLSEASRELSYQEFVDSVRGMGLRVQLSP